MFCIIVCWFFHDGRLCVVLEEILMHVVKVHECRIDMTLTISHNQVVCCTNEIQAT